MGSYAACAYAVPGGLRGRAVFLSVLDLVGSTRKFEFEWFEGDIDVVVEGVVGGAGAATDR